MWRGRAGLQARQIVIAAHARHQIRESASADGARVSLVEVRVAREMHIGPNARRGAGLIDLLEHGRAGHVVRAAGKRRMMRRDHQRAPLALGPLGLAAASCCCRNVNCALPILCPEITPSVPPSAVFEYRPMNLTNGALSVK